MFGWIVSRGESYRQITIRSFEMLEFARKEKTLTAAQPINLPPTSELDFPEGFQIQDSSFHPFDVVLELAESEITRVAQQSTNSGVLALAASVVYTQSFAFFAVPVRFSATDGAFSVLCFRHHFVLVYGNPICGLQFRVALGAWVFSSPTLLVNACFLWIFGICSSLSFKQLVPVRLVILGCSLVVTRFAERMILNTAVWLDMMSGKLSIILCCVANSTFHGTCL